MNPSKFYRFLQSNTFKSNGVIIFLFSAITIALYFSIFDNGFLSDDYDSLHRLLIEKKILITAFFRPLIDVSFFLNYLISGLNPFGFYVFNVAFHIANAYLLYKLAIRLSPFKDVDRQYLFALMTAVFFLIYPFHNEAVVWLTGRISSIACFFALLAVMVVVNDLSNLKKLILSSCFYIIGLLAYESIFFLPFIIIVLLWRKNIAARFYFKAGIVYGLTILIYILSRAYLSGVIYGNYGERMISGKGLQDYSIRFLKVLGRSVLPPFEDSSMLIKIFIAVCFALIVVHIVLFKNMKNRNLFSNNYVRFVLVFFISIILPVIFGISTRTSEGDRLLYFPSCFLSLMLSFIVIELFQQNILKAVSVLIISVYCIFFINKNIKNWNEASSVSNEIIQTVKENVSQKSIVLINVPDEIEGAFVFRNGFYKALVLNSIDTSRVKVHNYLRRLDYIKIAVVEPMPANKAQFIFPDTYIEQENNVLKLNNNKNGENILLNKDDWSVYYWNKKRLLKLY